MVDIEKICRYFGNCKQKHIGKFEEKTPDGNFIEGYICRKPNRYLGSLVITKLNGEPHEQFVQSMPKIEYFNDERDMVIWDSHTNRVEVSAYEKLDGSCLIVYPILENGKFVEIVPKTRGRAVADSNFLELFNKCDKTPIWEYYYRGGNKGVLFFEMYGILNQHDVIHYQTGIDLALIGCYTTRFFKGKALKNLCGKYGFKQPDMMFTWDQSLGDNYIHITTEKYKWWFSHVGIDWNDRIAPTARDAISKMVEFLEYLNNKFAEQNSRIAIEGVVVNCTNMSGDQKYIKVKPRDIEAKHRAEKGIPRRSIIKEVYKYFDDYGAEVSEIYAKDPDHHTEYIWNMLSEDYPMELIQKSKKKIENVFMQIWDSKQVPVSIHKICDDLITEYGDQGITHCMRMFAQKYPSKKRQARTIYQTLEIKFNKMGLEL